MYICVCKAVSDKRIHRAVGEGACTVRDLSRTLGLGTSCGKCVPAARELLAEALSRDSERAPLKLAELPDRLTARG